MDISEKTDESANMQLNTKPPDGQCVMSIQGHDDTFDIASCFREANYRVQIPVRILSNVMFTLVSVVDTDLSPNLVDNVFLPSARRKSMETIELVHLCTASRKSRIRRGNRIPLSLNW